MLAGPSAFHIDNLLHQDPWNTAMSIDAVRARAFNACGEQAKMDSLRNPGSRVWRNRMMLATLIDQADCQAFKSPSERHPSVCAFANIDLRSPEESLITGLPASAFCMSFNPQSANQCIISLEFKVRAFWRSPRIVPSGVIPDWHDADLEAWAEGAVAARMERGRRTARPSEQTESSEAPEPPRKRVTIAHAAPLLGRARSPRIAAAATAAT